MAEGRQVYVVCPLVEESEKLDLQAAEELYLELKEYFYKAYEVGLVHGRMKPSEKMKWWMPSIGVKFHYLFLQQLSKWG